MRPTSRRPPAGRISPPAAVARRILRDLESAARARELGRLGTARRRLDRTLALARKSLDPRHPLLAAVLNQLGMLGKAEGQFRVAGRHYREALELVRHNRSGALVELADLYHNLGGLEHARGCFLAGEPLARRAIRLRARRHGPGATITWLDRTAHAALLDGLRRFEESEAVYRRALEVFRRRLGSGHYEVAVTLNNLGCVRAELGDLPGAARCLRRALAIKRRLFGEGNVEVAVALNNLATVERESGREDEARILFRRAMTILSKRLGRDHPSTRACGRNLPPRGNRGRPRIGAPTPE